LRSTDQISDDERIAPLEIEPRTHQKTTPKQRIETPNNPATVNDPLIQAA
jgi:hypothetical protein